MNRIACLMVTGLALAAGPRSGISASFPPPPGDVEILVGNAAQPRYAHAGRWYVEARKGSEYAIRLRNPYGVRVAVALSVDGLNTIAGRETAAAAARKWVLGPYEPIVISGWQTSETEARRFEFTTEPHSYGQALGKTANLGVISAVYFRERVAMLSPYAANDSKADRAAPSGRSIPGPGAAEQSAAAARRAD